MRSSAEAVATLRDIISAVDGLRSTDAPRIATTPPVETKPEPSAPTDEQRPIIWSHGGRSYSIDGREQFVVTNEEDLVLTSFMKSREAMDGPGLESASGATNIPHIVKSLREGYGGVFGLAIRAPGGKAGDGYFADVREIHART